MLWLVISCICMAYLKKVAILANGCQRQGPKKRRKTSKNDAKMSKFTQLKGKNSAKNSYEILVDVVFRFAGYDMDSSRMMQGS